MGAGERHRTRIKDSLPAALLVGKLGDGELLRLVAVIHFLLNHLQE
jgi:hypothetical protein